MRKVKVELLGGLGNQLYGMALGLALVSKSKSIKVQITDSLIPFGSNSSRKLQVNELGLLGNKETTFTESNKFFILLLKRSKFFRKFWWKSSRLVNRKAIVTNENLWSQQLVQGKRVIFSDYFNDWFFAETAHQAGLLRQNHVKKTGETSALISAEAKLVEENLALVHLRIGDYLDFPDIFKLLPEKYYFSAIEKLSHQNNLRYGIVCESALEADKFYPSLTKDSDFILDKSSGLSDVDTFRLLCRAEKLIAANSTFSIWAAWFVQSYGKSAVVPVANSKLAEAEGYIYLNWNIFDVERDTFLQPKPELKDDWMTSKTIEFDKFLRSLESGN